VTTSAKPLARRPALGRLAAALVAASVVAGLLAVGARVANAVVSDLRTVEAVTLFLAASAYLAYALAHQQDRGELATRSILVTAFALWGDRPARSRLFGHPAAQRPHDPAVRRRPGVPTEPVGMTTDRGRILRGGGAACRQHRSPDRPHRRPPGRHGRWSSSAPNALASAAAATVAWRARRIAWNNGIE